VTSTGDNGYADVLLDRRGVFFVPLGKLKGLDTTLLLLIGAARSHQRSVPSHGHVGAAGCFGTLPLLTRDKDTAAATAAKGIATAHWCGNAAFRAKRWAKRKPEWPILGKRNI